jgi:cytochrome c oxidase assembly protein subunit 15
MPFDVLHFPGAGPDDRASSRASRRLVAMWLFGICGMLGVMVVLGGTTRLTGSGLSIMEWAPLSGFIPPLDEAEWARLFAEYKTIPQYHLLHEGFGLAGFKQIFWLEWTHRLWGRLIGLAFFVPLVWLWFSGRIERRLRPRLALLFALGALQGAVGWFMVESGFFPDSTAVSAYRLVVHLSLALVLYGTILWTAMTLLHPRGTLPAPGRRLPGEPPPRLADRLIRPLALCLAALVALTIVAGGFVAGNHAGLDYNTFPLMDGHLVPEGYDRLSPWLRNLTENIPAVQFDHRLLATLSAVFALAVLGFGAARPGLRPVLAMLGGAILLQYALGVATLLYVVPVPLAAAHQAGAVVLLTAALAVLHAVRPALNRRRIKDMSRSDPMPDSVAQRQRRQTRPF